jgi:hypothetical protein
MSDTPTAADVLLARIRQQSLRLADLAHFDQQHPFAAAYSSVEVLEALEAVRTAAADAAQVRQMLEQPRHVATLYAVAPWPVLDVLLPHLESTWEAEHATELLQHVRQHCPPVLLESFDFRIRCIERVSKVVQLVRWQHPNVVAAVGQNIRIRAGV